MKKLELAALPGEVLTREPILRRSYSRRIEETLIREDWPQVIARTLDGICKVGNLTDEEISLLESQALALRALPSGRWLWVGGTEWIQVDRNFAGGYNCSTTELSDTVAFGLMMDVGMTGCGTGAVLEDRCIKQLPIVRNRLNIVVEGEFGDHDPGNPDTIFSVSDDGDRVSIQVGDSRKGWVLSYQGLIELSMDSRLAPDVEVSVNIGHVRPFGRSLKGFGGVSNPIKLPLMYPRVAEILNGAVGRQLTAEECCLLIDEPAVAIAAGNIRRFAGIRQFSPDQALLKQKLWVQDEDGQWRIDPKRDSLRAANHTRVFHKKPTESECIDSVRSQFKSGEGAIQWAGEAIARANADLLTTWRLHFDFLAIYEKQGKLAAAEFLLSIDPKMSEQEVSDRLHRYGLNPCFGAGTLILTRKPDGEFSQQAIESLVGKTVEVFDGQEWVAIDNFRVTGRNCPMLRIEVGLGVVRTTEYHDFFLEDGTRKQARDLEVGDRLLYMVDDADGNDLSYFYTVAAITPDGIDPEVYCCTVPTNHRITLGSGLITGQCGEILMRNNFCDLADVHLKELDPMDFAGQRDAFRAAALWAVPLLHHDLSQIDPRYQYSRLIDPIVGVSFTGLFDFFVKAFGVDWLRWWEAGRPDKWYGAYREEDQDLLESLSQIGDRSVCSVLSRDQSVTNGQAKSVFFQTVERAYLKHWRSIVEEVVWDYCDRNGLRRPNRCTTVQPSGSKSLLTGSSPGWHPPKAARFIRRMTFRKNDPVALACLDCGYNVVPSQSDKDEHGNLLNDPFDPRCTEWLVEIPVAVDWADMPGADTIAIEQFSALAQFDFYMQVQRYYTTHNCFAQNTQFLTSEGVRTFESFEAGDTVTVLNADGDWVPATVVNTGDDRPMLTITIREGKTGKEKTITSTHCHRFPVRRASAGDSKVKILQAKDLKIGHRLVLNLADLPDLDEDGIRHGIVFGDGSLYKNSKGEYHKAQLYLCGGKRHLQSYFGGYERTYERDDIDQTRIYGLPMEWKSLPSVDRSQSYLAGFIAGLLATDGNISGSTVSIATGRQSVVDYLLDQSPRIGIKVTGFQWFEASGFKQGSGAFQIRFSKSTFPENMLLRPHHMEHFRAHESQPCQWRVVDIQDAAPQVGWCVMEPLTNHFTLTDNILVMNTSATIELREPEIEPLGRRIYEAIKKDEGYVSAALLARFDDLETFPRLPFEPISRERYDSEKRAIEARRKPGFFGEHLARHDLAAGVTADLERGATGCDSDKCLLPEHSP